jgi:hypothetical protein
MLATFLLLLVLLGGGWLLLLRAGVERAPGRMA